MNKKTSIDLYLCRLCITLLKALMAIDSHVVEYINCN